MRNPRADPEAAHYRGLAYPYIVNPPNAVAYRSATARVRRQAMLRPTLGDRFVNSVELSCPHCSTVSTPRGPWCAAPRPRGAASSSETAHQCIWRPSTHPKVLDAAAQGVCCHSVYELYRYIRCQTEEYLGHKPPRQHDLDDRCGAAGLEAPLELPILFDARRRDAQSIVWCTRAVASVRTAK